MKSENGFHLREIRPQGGFQLRNPNPDFWISLFVVRVGNPKKDLLNCSREQRFSEVKSVFGFHVRLGNPDLDLGNLNPDFPIERTRKVHRRVLTFSTKF